MALQQRFRSQDVSSPLSAIVIVTSAMLDVKGGGESSQHPFEHDFASAEGGWRVVAASL